MTIYGHVTVFCQRKFDNLDRDLSPVQIIKFYLTKHVICLNMVMMTSHHDHI